MAALANIRHVERNYLRSLLLPGHLVQVSGPPMIGKLTVVNQVLKDLELSSRLQGSLHLSLQPGPFIYHRFSCKHTPDGQAVLRNIAVNLMRPLPDTQDLGFLTTTVLSDLKSVVQLTDDQLQTRCHHIFVFEKCESLVTHDSDHWFLCYVSELMQELASHLVTVVFTSYKRFEWSGFHPDRRDTMVIGPVQDGDGNLCFTLEIEQLKDTDILCLLQHFAPAVDPSPYLHVFQRFLGFPEAVRKVAQTFLIASATGNGGAALSSSSLDNLVKTDLAFLHSVFSSRLDEVMDWVGWENLLILRHLGSCMESSATEECFKSVAAGDLDYGRWTCLSYMLHRFYIIRKLPGVQRLVVHPLVIYFCWTQLRAILVALRGQETNLFSNRFTHFLCATLSNLDACSTLKGRQLAVVTNMLYECPNIRHVISMALLANEDSYGVYLKLAISGGGMLSLLCPREVITFFACLYKRSKVCGRGLIERAILRGLYGQALAWGTGTGSFGRASGGNWQESTEHLTEAINVLSRPGVEPSYYLLLFLTEKAKIQARLGKYDESLRVFLRARSLFGQIRTHALGEIFAVTETKLRETELITCVYETVPMIFKGNNALAKERLLTLVEVIEQEFPNSIELPTAHNQLGLSEQRGRSSAESTERAKARYLICLRLRTYFLKINPIPLYAPLNNVAMLCYRSNDLGQFYNLLEKALQISREFDWDHYYTGLSLVHLAEGSIGRGHFMSALLYLKEGERVLTLTAKDHDLRHRALLELAHVMVTLAPGSSHERSMQVGQQTDTCNPSLPRDGELVQSARGMCKQIAQDDLNKSAKYYLERLTELAKDMKGTLSDDGHHFVLSAYEHALSLNWGRPEEMDKFISLIFDHVEKNKFIELFQEEAPKKYHNLHRHKNVYQYLKECRDNVHEVDLSTFLAKQIPACTICAYGERFFTEEMWFREINVLIERQRRSKALSRYLPSSPDTCQIVSKVPSEGLADNINILLTQYPDNNEHNTVRGHLINSNQRSMYHETEKKSVAFSDNSGPTSPNKNIEEREQAISESSPLCQFAGLGSTHQPFIKQDISSTGATWSNSKKDGELSKCNREIPRFDLINSNSGSDGTNSLDMYVLCGQPIPQSGSSERNFMQEFHQSFNFAAPSSQSHERPCKEPVEHTEPLDFLPREADEPVSSRRQPQEDEDQATGGDAGAELTFCHGNQLHVILPFTRKAVEDIWQTSPQIGAGCNDQCRNTDNNMDDNFEKISHFQQKDNILQQGLKELTLSRQLESSVDQSGSGFASSSGRGSMNRSTMDGTPSVFLDQPRDCDTHSVPNQIQGARPKTISNKKRSKSEHQ